MLTHFRNVVLLLSIWPALAFARVYPVIWTEPAQVEYIRIAATGDGVNSVLDTADLIFVKLKDQAVLNPANCGLNDKYAFIPAASNGKESLMYSTLLAAAVARLKVELSVSTQYCDNVHPTVYDVRVAF